MVPPFSCLGGGGTSLIGLSLVEERPLSVVNIHAAKTQLSRLVEEAASGSEVIIARAGRPIARLVALERKPGRRRLGSLSGRLQVPDAFDAPLPDEMLAAFEGG